MSSYEIHLQVKTRNGASPIDKTRIYLSYAKNDKDLMLEKRDYLLKMFDCAVYYMDQDVYDNPDVKEAQNLLKNINIFVPIITKRYLDPNNCFELRNLFSYARNNKIPIMPLIQDKSLHSQFNKICGHIQFADDSKDNSNQETIDRKIKAFYQSIVNPDNLNQIIPKHFKNKIFISYRRKDKELIKPVLEVLSNDEELYDTSIWFDDFLSVGKIYDKEITNKLKSANIVIFLVTDNIFEKGNFVKDEEYPVVETMNKNNISIYFNKYNKEEFAKHYPYLNEPTTLDNLVGSIKQYLKPVERNNEHDAYVALGYLRGISVPKNEKRGEEILLRHIDDPFSMKILRDYYFNNKDYGSAIKYGRIAFADEVKNNPDSISEEIYKYLDILVFEKTHHEEMEEVMKHILKVAKNNSLDEEATDRAYRSLLDANEILCNKEIDKELFLYIQKLRSKSNPTFEDELYYFQQIASYYLRNEDNEKAIFYLEEFTKFINAYDVEEAFTLLSKDNFSNFANLEKIAIKTKYDAMENWGYFIHQSYLRHDSDLGLHTLAVALFEGVKLYQFVRKYECDSIPKDVAQFEKYIRTIDSEVNIVLRANVYRLYFSILIEVEWLLGWFEEEVEWLFSIYDRYDGIRHNSAREALLVASKAYEKGGRFQESEEIDRRLGLI